MDDNAASVVEALTVRGVDGAAIGTALGLATDTVRRTLRVLEEVFHAGDVEPAAEWPQSVTDLRLVTSTGCNVTCAHCYTRRLWGSQSAGLMTEDVADEALSWFSANAPRDRQLTVRFFGGEPTLNWPVIEHATLRASALFGESVRVLLNTNALLLDEQRCDFLRDNGIHTVVSLDSVSDDVGYHTAAAKAMEAIHMLVNRGCHVSVSTVAGPGLNAAELVRALAGAGVSEIGINEARFPSTSDPRLVDEIVESIVEAWRTGMECGVNVGGEWRWLIERLESCDRTAWRYCHGQGNEASVMPSGDVYTCAASRFRLGSIFQPSLLNCADAAVDLGDRRDFVQRACSGCSVEYACRGGCLADAAWISGELTTLAGCEFRRRVVDVFLHEMANQDGGCRARESHR